MAEACCEKCRWFVKGPFVALDGEMDGECHRYAPHPSLHRIVRDEIEPEYDYRLVQWPLVRPHFWCGDFVSNG